MWNLAKINWADARALPGFKEPTSVSVAVLDTGIDTNHPDLDVPAANYTYQHPQFPSNVSASDIVGHGTHVAGTIAAVINNSLGINGMCSCNTLAWKIFSDQPTFINYYRGYSYFVDPVLYYRALSQCITQKVDVVNLSIGGGAPPEPNEAILFSELIRRGTVVVAAMGNERQLGSPVSYPAAVPGVIAVGATSLNDVVAGFSNRGNHITLCAPGVAIWSTLPTYAGQTGFYAVPDASGKPTMGKPHARETSYGAWDGTSMAAPHVAAAVAMLLATKGRMSPADVEKALRTSADKTPAMTGNPDAPVDYGAGRLNLLQLLT
jgi:subtilisin family serine protease